MRDENLDTKTGFNFCAYMTYFSVKVQLELWAVTEMNTTNSWNM